MRSYFLIRPGQLELREIPRPQPQTGELIIKVATALTCGTDLKAFRRGHPKFRMPTPFGHEFSGTIVDAGMSVNGYREGDAVMSVHTAPCGDCYYCQRGMANLCPETMDYMLMGAYSEYIKLPAKIVSRNTFKKPGHLSFDEAAFLEPLACVVHGMKPLLIRPDDTVLIIGAGAIGLLHILLARLRGARKILVAGKHRERLLLAKQLGGDVVIDAARQNTRHLVLDLTHGFGANWVFECTGKPEVWEESLWLVSKGGGIIFFGGCPSGTRVTMDTKRLHYDQITLYGTFHFNPEDVREAYRLLAEKHMDVRPLITKSFPLAGLETAFQLLQKGDGIKYAIHP